MLLKSKAPLAQAIRALAKHEVWGGVRFDRFTQSVLLPGGERLEEHHLVEARVWCGEAKAKGVTAEVTWAALAWLAQQRAFDALEEHLAALPPWDGRQRLDSWLPEVTGCVDTPLARWIGRKWLVSAMARALRPGCQVDHALVLYGRRQGEGKSRLVRLLGGPHYREMRADLTSRDALMQLSGAWIVEFADLGGLQRSERHAAKAFITQPVDTYRAPYARTTSTHPRRCAFIVTTNDLDFVDDPSGGRRWWPVEVGVEKSMKTLEKDERDQLLAESRIVLDSGEKWFPSEEDGPVLEMLREAQSGLQQEDSWLGEVQAWVNKRETVSVADVLGSAIGLVPAQQTHAHSMRAAACLKSLGFQRFQDQRGGQRVWRYRRVGTPGTPGTPGS